MATVDITPIIVSRANRLPWGNCGRADWRSKSVKREMYDNFMAMLARGEELFPGIIGYEDTVIPEINLGLIAQHDMLFLGEKGQAKSRLMRLLGRFLDESVPYLDIPRLPGA